MWLLLNMNALFAFICWRAADPIDIHQCTPFLFKQHCEIVLGLAGTRIGFPCAQEHFWQISPPAAASKFAAPAALERLLAQNVFPPSLLAGKLQQVGNGLKWVMILLFHSWKHFTIQSHNFSKPCYFIYLNQASVAANDKLFQFVKHKLLIFAIFPSSGVADKHLEETSLILKWMVACLFGCGNCQESKKCSLNRRGSPHACHCFVGF